MTSKRTRRKKLVSYVVRGFFGLLKIAPSDTEEDDGLKHNYNSEERDHDLEKVVI